jgi:hypothetical protein
MARPGTAKAKDILEGVMADFCVDLAMLRSSGSRTENLCRAKQAYLDRCGAETIPIVIMAEVLGVTRFTIRNRRSHPEVREKMNTRQNQRRLQNPRHRRSRAKVRVAAFMGQW